MVRYQTDMKEVDAAVLYVKRNFLEIRSVIMAQRSHAMLQEWYRRFAREVYNKANIKVDCPIDLGRIKNFSITSWDENEPLMPRGEFMYAFIPHEDGVYDNPPPDAGDFDEYFEWIENNLRPATTDDEIEALMEMSMAGTLMIYSPGAMGSEMQQVHTDEDGNITVSLPINKMNISDAENVPAQLRLPNPPANVPVEPNPEDYGLHNCPPKPVRPRNMNPGFLSWLGYLIGLNTDYAKKRRYEKDSATYDRRFSEWFESLRDIDEALHPEARVLDYMTDKEIRDQYLLELKEFKSQPLGMARAIENSWRTNYERQLSQEQIEQDGKRPTEKVVMREMHFLQSKHIDTPHGKLFHSAQSINADTNWAKNAQDAMTYLLGHNPRPDELKFYLDYRVYLPGTYHPEPYDLPQLEGEHTQQEREDFRAKMAETAELASFAALAHPDVTGTIMPRKGFTKEESAILNFSMVSQNVMTGPRPQSSQFMDYLYPARELGKKAMEAYAAGNVKPLADLFRTAIQRNNREAATKTGFLSSSSSNTLYFIRRMYEFMQRDDKLMRAVNLSGEELTETLANIEMHKIVTKGVIARKQLMEHARNLRTMSPEELREAVVDLRLVYSLDKQVAAAREESGRIAESGPEFIAAIEELSTNLEAAQNKIDLLNSNLPACKYLEKLLQKGWINDARDAMAKTCNIDRINTMSREEIGAMLHDATGKDLEAAFKFSQVAPKENRLDEPVVQKENAGPNLV